MFEKEIKVVPEFNSEMEIVSVTVSCEDEGVLGMLDKETIQGILNNELGEQYNIHVEVRESQFQELQDNGIVKITLQTETVITENNSMLVEAENIKDIENISSEKKVVFRDSNRCFLTRKVNKKAYEILSHYLEQDFIISEAIISREMSSYKTIMSLDKDGDTVWRDVKQLTPISVKLLDKIAHDVDINSTGMDNQTVVSMYEQLKNDDVFLKLEFYFNDGNIIGKYKLEKANKFAARYVDISF